MNASVLNDDLKKKLNSTIDKELSNMVDERDPFVFNVKKGYKAISAQNSFQDFTSHTVTTTRRK